MFLRSSLIKFPRITYNIAVRTCTTHKNNSATTESKKDWCPIYEFRSIKFLGLLNKLKIYQSAVTAAGVPLVMGLETMQILPAQTTEVFAIVGITGTLSLCLYSLLSKNTIGFVHVNPILKKIRFSYLDFWGRRKSQDLTLNEIVSSDKKGIFNTYVVVETSTAVGSLKLLKYGEVIDRDIFYRIFGDM